MENINNKIEETLSSLDGIKPAKMPSDLYTKILHHIEYRDNTTLKIVPMRRVLLAAAVFVGIIFLNVWGVLSSQNSAYTEGVTQQQTGVQVFANAYFNDSSFNY